MSDERPSTSTSKRCSCKLDIIPVEIDPLCMWHGVNMKSDPINHPRHYNIGKIEVIAAIEDWGLGFHLGNVVKYVARAEHKGSVVEDLKKARWYLDRRIEQFEGKKKPNE